MIDDEMEFHTVEPSSRRFSFSSNSLEDLMIGGSAYVTDAQHCGIDKSNTIGFAGQNLLKDEKRKGNLCHYFVKPFVRHAISKKRLELYRNTIKVVVLERSVSGRMEEDSDGHNFA